MLGNFLSFFCLLLIYYQLQIKLSPTQIMKPDLEMKIICLFHPQLLLNTLKSMQPNDSAIWIDCLNLVRKLDAGAPTCYFIQQTCLLHYSCPKQKLMHNVFSNLSMHPQQCLQSLQVLLHDLF